MADNYGAMLVPIPAPPGATRLQYPTTFEEWTAALVTASDGVDQATLADPDDGPKASLITESTDVGAQTHQLSLAAVTDSDTGGACTFSVAAKANTRDWVELLDDGASCSGYFNLAGGVVGTATGCTSTITALGSGWYLCSIAYDDHAVAGALQIRLASADATDSYTGDGSSLYLYDAQLDRTGYTHSTASDPALDYLVAYLDAVLNQYGQTAWAAVAPGETVVKTSWARDPRDGDLRVADMPSLWAHRSRTEHEWLGDGWPTNRTTIEILWIFQPASLVGHADHATFINGIANLIRYALRKGRDASYVIDGDTDETAAARGSVIQRHCGWNQMRVGVSQTVPVEVVSLVDGTVESKFKALSTELHVIEKLTLDPSVHAEAPTVIEGDITREDGTSMGEFVVGHDARAFGTPLEVFELDHENITKPGDLIERIPGWIDPDTYALTALTTARPTYEVLGWGGVSPSMLLNGTAQRMICDAIADELTGLRKPWSLVMAIQWVAHTATRVALSLGNSDEAVPLMSLASDGASHIDIERQDEWGVTDTALGTADTSARCIYGLSFDGKLVSTHVNETKELDAEDIEVGNLPLDQFTIGSLRTDSETLFANIRVGAIWLYAEALSDEMIVAASAKMAERWPTP